MKSILIQAAIMNSRQLDLMQTRQSRSCTPLIPVAGFAVAVNSTCSQRRKVSGKRVKVERVVVLLGFVIEWLVPTTASSSTFARSQSISQMFETQTSCIQS